MRKLICLLILPVFLALGAGPSAAVSGPGDVMVHDHAGEGAIGAECSGCASAHADCGQSCVSLAQVALADAPSGGVTAPGYRVQGGSMTEILPNGRISPPEGDPPRQLI